VLPKQEDGGGHGLLLQRVFDQHERMILGYECRVYRRVGQEDYAGWYDRI